MKAYRKVYKNKYNTQDKQLSEKDKNKLKQLKLYLNYVRSGKLNESEYKNLLKNINKK